MTAMRLNWFSPLPPARTDIAHYTARIAPALMRRFDVAFWTDLKTSARILPPGADLRVFDAGRIAGRRFNSQIFNGLNIYNFGNDARFHHGIARVARKIPGLVVLHDTHLHHFAFESARADERPFSSYLESAREIYGPAGEAKARKIVKSDGRAIDEYVAEMPFVEPFLENAIGAICHSRAASEDVRLRSDAPLLTLPLPFASMAGAPKVERRWTAPWRFVMFGYINPNRRLESVLRALANWRDAPEFRFDIYGVLWNRPLIEQLIAENGLKSRAAFHGFASEQELDEAVASAHLAFNLRHPTVGEASGALLRSWAHATPALVTDAGFYADLPDDSVRKISVDNECADILRALDELVGNPSLYQKMGLAARERLRALHSPDVYADKLAAALADLPHMMTRFAGRRLMLDVAVNSASREERSLLLQRASEWIPSLFVPA